MDSILLVIIYLIQILFIIFILREDRDNSTFMSKKKQRYLDELIVKLEACNKIRTNMIEELIDAVERLETRVEKLEKENKKLKETDKVTKDSDEIFITVKEVNDHNSEW